jgi:hypothetical protein
MYSPLVSVIESSRVGIRLSSLYAGMMREKAGVIGIPPLS